MEQTYRQSSVSLCITLGVILSLLTVLAYAFSLDLFTKWWFGLLTPLLVIVFGVVASSKTRKLTEGFTSFKEAFTGYFITVVIGWSISTAVALLLFNVVDTEAAQILNDKVIESSAAMMERFGTPQSEIEKMVVQMENENQFSVKNYLIGWAGWIVFFSIIGLIVALIFKQKDPHKA